MRQKTISLRIGLLAVILALVCVSAVQAAGSGVQDNAGFFSQEARDTAEQQIATLRKQFGKDLRVETYPGIPPELAAQFTPEKQEAFFASWAFQRGKAAGVDGVMVLVCKDPAFLQVAVGEQTQQQAFTLANRDHLRDILLTTFRQKRFDDGLLQAVTYYGTTLQANLGKHGTPAHPSMTSPSEPYPSWPVPQQSPRSAGNAGKILFWGVIILVGLGLCAWLFRRRRGGPGAYRNVPPGYGDPTSDYPYGDRYGDHYGNRYGGGWGGGFGRGFGGGILGGLLGGWLGNRLSQRDHPSYPDASSWPSSNAPDGGGRFDAPDFSGSGPADTGGGGDFGGGDQVSEENGGGGRF